MTKHAVNGKLLQKMATNLSDIRDEHMQESQDAHDVMQTIMAKYKDVNEWNGCLNNSEITTALDKFKVKFGVGVAAKDENEKLHVTAVNATLIGIRGMLEKKDPAGFGEDFARLEHQLHQHAPWASNPEDLPSH